MISAQFGTSLQSPTHIAGAERLDYDHAWLSDTPHESPTYESPNIWTMLALAAAALAAMAPGRVAVAFGTGFADARALGAEPASWSYLRE